MKRAYLIGIVFLLLVSFGHAQLLFFSDQSEFQFPSCSNTIDTIKLVNTDASVKVIELSISQNQQWFTFSQNRLFLEPGSDMIVDIIINPPCQTIGSYDYTIDVSANDEVYKYERSIELYREENLQASVSDSYLQSCQCETQTFTYTVRNTGTTVETYTVSSPQPQVTLSPDNIVVLPGQFFTGMGYARYACDDIGKKDIDVYFEAFNSQQKGKVQIDYEIEQCYDHSLSKFSKSYDICPQPVAIPFKLSNTGKFTEDFSVFIDGPSYVTVNSPYVIEAGQEVIDFVYVNGSQAQKESFTIISQSNNIVQSETIQLKPQTNYTCYGLKLSPKVVVTNQSNMTHALTISHNGLMNATYMLSLNSTNWTILENSLITLGPNQKTNVFLTTNVSNVTGSFYSSLNAQTNEYIQVLLFELKVVEQTDYGFLIVMWIYILLLILLLLLIILAVTKKSKQPSRKKKAVETSPEKEAVEAKAAPKATVDKKKTPRKTSSSKKDKRKVVLFILILLLLFSFVAIFTFMQTSQNTNQTIENNSVVNNTIVNETYVNDTIVNDTYIFDNATGQNNKTSILRSIWDFLFKPVPLTDNNTIIQNDTTTAPVEEPVDEPVNETTDTEVINESDFVTSEPFNFSTFLSEFKYYFVPKQDASLTKFAQNISGPKIEFEAGKRIFVDIDNLFIDLDNDTLYYDFFFEEENNLDAYIENQTLSIWANRNTTGVQTLRVSATDEVTTPAYSPQIPVIIYPYDDKRVARYIIWGIVGILILLLLLFLDVTLLKKRFNN